MKNIIMTGEWKLPNEEWFYFENEEGKLPSRIKGLECRGCHHILGSATKSNWPAIEAALRGRADDCIKVAVMLKDYDECRNVLERCDEFASEKPVHGKYGGLFGEPKTLLFYADGKTFSDVLSELRKASESIAAEPCFVYKGCNFKYMADASGLQNSKNQK